LDQVPPPIANPVDSGRRCNRRRGDRFRGKLPSLRTWFGVSDGKLECREGAVWGNPFLRILRSQLEPDIAEELGSEYVASKKSLTELRAVNKEIADLRKRLIALEGRKAVLQRAVKK
jgi:hypothetical protein